MCGHVEATQRIGEVCRAVGLCLTCIQPLRDVIESRQPPANGATKATKLFPVMEALNTKLLLVCSSALPADQLNPSTQTAVDNLRVIRTAAANWSPDPTKVTFEALLWGTHINLWCQAWTIVLAVDMENIGVPMDSLNTLAWYAILFIRPTHKNISPSGCKELTCAVVVNGQT
jgi:4-hydroxyphenylpyruvate dioxygenase